MTIPGALQMGPHDSLNQVRILDLPGVALDPQVRGQKGYDLLSVEALVRDARRHAAALDLPLPYQEDTPQTWQELPPWVNRCLESPQPAANAARAIAHRLGHNLGALVLTLHRGDPINRAARPDWDDHTWARWAAVRHIWLAGGLLRGAMAPLIVATAQAFLAQAGAAHLHLALTPYLDGPALLGAGRCLPITHGDALCFDIGHTLIKRGCLRFERGRLVGLRPYPPLPVTLPAVRATGRRPNAAEILTMLVTAIADTLHHCIQDGLTPATELALSIATYVHGPRFVGGSFYTTLNQLGPDVGATIAAALLTHTGQQLQPYLVHDGTAAALAHAEHAHSAMIVLGTALGVGFPTGDATGLALLASPIFNF